MTIPDGIYDNLNTFQREYKELFLTCVSEGYDAAERQLKGKSKELECPYSRMDWYEYAAFMVGAEWYQSSVH